nr:BrnT family toxin [Clostridium sp. AF50-3]
MTDRKGVCIVSHCYHEEDEKIRIISARKATKTEQNVYNEQPFWR